MIVRRIARRLRSRRAEARFAKGEGIPWTPGYVPNREALIRATLEDSELLDVFRRNEALPPRFGVGIDERCIEYPWVMARLGEGEGRLLDAGSALNHAFTVQRPELSAKTVHILTLAPEHEAFWRLGMSYLYADLREIPIRDDYYDAVVSVSTLEHVGAANELFTSDKRSFEQANGDRLDAVRELRRVLKPGGRFLFTVPFGARRDHVTFEQFDSALLDELTGAFGGRQVDAAFYRYDSDGWHAASREECAGLEYSAGAADLWQTGRLPTAAEPDRAAAARAVACVELQKDEG